MSRFKGKYKTTSGGAATEIPSAGNHAAVLVAIIDLGTHMESFQGGPAKPTAKVLFVWELVDEQLSGTTNNHLISRQFTLSFHKKSALMGMLRTWKGKELPEGFEIDLAILLGKKCMLSVVHVESKDGERTYANADSISQQPKNFAIGDPQHEPFFWTIDNPERDDYPDPDWVPWTYDKGRQIMGPVNDMILACLELNGGIPDLVGEDTPEPVLSEDRDESPF